MQHVKERAYGNTTLTRVRDFLDQYKTDRAATIGLTIVILWSFIALLAPFISPYGFSEMVGNNMGPPSLNHLLGLDTLGRDILSRIIWGARLSLVFGIIAALVSMIIGVILGSVAGYYGGLVDDILSRFFEIFLTVPPLLLIMVIVALFGTNIYFTMLVVGLTVWPANAKLMRAQASSLREREYVEAASVSGATGPRILVTHVIPNGIFPVMANSALQVGHAIITEASLSFIGLGDLNVVSWGQILRSGQSVLASAWWVSIFSGLAIFSLVLAFNMVGDGVSAVLNPSTREFGR